MTTEPAPERPGGRRSVWAYVLMAAAPLIPLLIGLFIVLTNDDDDSLPAPRHQQVAVVEAI